MIDPIQKLMLKRMPIEVVFEKAIGMMQKYLEAKKEGTQFEAIASEDRDAFNKLKQQLAIEKGKDPNVEEEELMLAAIMSCVLKIEVDKQSDQEILMEAMQRRD